MDAALNHLRTELAGRYEVEQELGRGGMAVVYLAKDLRHERRVAIKVLRSDLGSSGSDRFLREIRTVAQLHHPHILQLLDSGTASDHLFYVMPYVEGETLREKLEREGQLPVDEAVRIAREVADALDFAHGRGIVHRDIKPENIFLSAGHALVADFGIARAADAAKQGDTTLTDVGLAVGTPAYMSPEQATADPRIDGRSDQYALGCVLYEMLAGQPPFTGPTSQAILARHTADPVPPLRTVRDVPAAVESAVVRALAKVPADRWPSASTFVTALVHPQAPVAARRDRAMAVRTRASVSVVVALTAVLIWRFSGGEPAAAQANNESVTSVGIAPFTVRGDTSNAAMNLAAGLAEGLNSGLVRVGEGLRVATGGGPPDGRAVDPLEVGRTLRVDAVVYGMLQVMGNRFRVTPQLVRVADGTVVWGGAVFDGELVANGEVHDPFAMQDSITARIVEAIRPRLSIAARATLARGVRTRSPEAWDLYLQARRADYDRQPQAYARAVEQLRRAVQLDSTFADAWLFLNEATLSYQLGTGHTPQEASLAAGDALDRAIRLDPSNGEALAIRARIRWHRDWDWDGAVRDIKHALELSPGSASVQELGFGFLHGGNPDSVLALARRTHDSSAAGSWATLGEAYYYAGKLDSALAPSERAVRMDPSQWTSYHTLMHLYHDIGRSAAADSAAAKYLTLGGLCCSQSLAYLSVYYRRSGNESRARDVLAQMITMTKERHVPGSDMAAARLAVGDRDGAVEELQRAVRERDRLLVQNLWFTLAPLRGEPGYDAIVRQVYGTRSMPRSPFPR